MIVTIFRSRLREDTDGYADVAREMLDLAREVPGFVSFKTFAHADGERCSVAVFADWESHHAWARHPRHVEAQRRGREEFYAEFSITAAEVVRVTEFHHDESTTID